MSTFVSTLWITLIGMGLVFVALLLLWLLMDTTVRSTAWYNVRHPEEVEGEEEAEETPGAEELPAALPAGVKQQAAAAAVAVALALQDEAPEIAGAASLPLGYASQPSAWQTVMRSAQLTQRSSHFVRKSRGNVR
jgi:sodium pump decarboxylase gamma subunit